MELELRGVAVDVVDGEDTSEVALVGDPSTGGWSWRLANTGRSPIAVRSVAVRLAVVGASGALRAFRHGHQSWSPASTLPVAGHTDPATVPGALEMVRWTHHADDAVPVDAAVRSEWFTVLADDHDAILVGALGGDRHDTVLRIHTDQLVVEAYLGGAVVPAGESRELHEVVVRREDPSRSLPAWADTVGGLAGARTSAPFQVGWCSWYHYFHNVTEDDLRANLAAAGDWPFEVVQLDDGFQASVGDWLEVNDSFRSPLDVLAADIRTAGFTPGLWIAPFLAAPDSRLAREHPDWLARHADGEPLIGMYNEHWGGFVHVLDTTHPEVLEHLEGLARGLVERGFPYLKLDFTYAPGFPGGFQDRGLTPAERVRAGFDAIRRGAGDDTFLLGCGAPLGPCVGVVDGMRIGPDVAPWWNPMPELWGIAGYDEVLPATVNAWRNTLTRSFMHRRLWLNDPDCVMLRTSDTDLTPAQVRGWAEVVGASGGMVLVSDDLALLDGGSRELLEEVIATGRAVDAAAIAGAPPICPDLLESDPPGRLVSTAAILEGDPATGAASLVRA